MKLPFLTTVLLFSSVFAHAQDATKAETEAWINGKLKENTVYIKFDDGDYTEQKKSISVNNCDCKITWVTTDAKKVERTSIAKFNFSKMTEISVKPDVYKERTGLQGNLYLINIAAFNDEKVIEFEDGQKSSGIFVMFQEKEFAERVQKAMQHYMKLCGGKKEKF